MEQKIRAYQEKKITVYHCTRKDLLPKILEEGLKKTAPFQRSDKPEGVYVSEKMFYWMWNSTDAGKVKGAILELDVTGLPLVKDFHTHPLDADKDPNGDWICQADIEPSRIKTVFVEKDDEPNCFVVYKKNQMIIEPK
jgi:hypothetical protein